MTTTMAQPGLAPDINLLEAMDIFKNFPDEELPNYRNDPKLALVAAAEMDRRLRIRKDFEAKQQKPSGPIIDQLQQQLLAPPMAQPMQPMGQPMQQPMGQPMAQQEMQQQGLGSLVPGMAQGGPVAFSGGGDPDEERKKRDRQAMEESLRSLGASAMDVLTLPGRGALGAAEFAITRPLRALGVNVPYLPESVYGGDRASMTPYYDRLRKERGEDQPVAPQADATKQTDQPKPAEQRGELNSLIAQLIKLQQSQQAPAAPAVDLKGLEKLAAAYTPAQVPVMSVEERRRVAEEEEKYRQQKFPDRVSPMAEQLAAELGQQVSPEEARRRAFMKAGIAGLGYTGRDFGAGLAGMLEGYEGTRQSVEAANKEAKTLALKARLANEQYKDALKRKDYESATKYADEVAQIKAAQVEAQNKAKLGKLGVMGAMQDLMTPKKAAGAGAASGMPKFADAARIRHEAVIAAQTELRAHEKQYDDEASMFHSALGKGKRTTNWRDNPTEKAKFDTEQEQIIRKYEARLYPTIGADQGVTTLTPQMMEAIREYVKKQSGK